MCGRYVSPDDAAIERAFDLPAAGRGIHAHYNVAPSERAPVIRLRDGALRLEQLRFGLVPFFAKGQPGRYATFNARVETLETSASFRGPWRRAQRCLVPAQGFYEWHLNANGSKQPYYVELTDQPIFAFAGLWDRSVADDGSALESFTIITMSANALLSRIHNARRRMPAVLARDALRTWLEGSAAAARAVLAPYPDGSMRAYPVSARVNSPWNDDPALIAPLPEAIP